MGVKVAKFGGSSLADSAQFEKVKEIILADKDRVFIVPSAPGKRFSADIKITDLLYECHYKARSGEKFDDVFATICRRYDEIIKTLDISLDLSDAYKEIKQNIPDQETADYSASRGEYLNGMILAAYLGFEFVDAGEVIHFDAGGGFDAETTQSMCEARLKPMKNAVIPGFYGAMPNGQIKTFSRGGSDVSGAIIARGVGAELYENWTDVSGFLMADPRIVQDPKPIEMITYAELRELSYMGATVLHEEAIFPVREGGIPINIKNTNAPSDVGTMIVKSCKAEGTITGIAGKKGFTIISLEKTMMNTQLGYGRKLLSVLENHGISFEHMPSSIDSISVVIPDAELKGKLSVLLSDIQEMCNPDSLDVSPDMALIATVGRGMVHSVGVAASLFAGLAKAKVNIRLIDQGSSELNIIVGVESADFEKAIKAIYEAFIV